MVGSNDINNQSENIAYAKKGEAKASNKVKRMLIVRKSSKGAPIKVKRSTLDTTIEEHI